MPYLAQWNSASSNLAMAVAAASSIFGKNPPLYARPANQPFHPPQQPTPAARPPVPPVQAAAAAAASGASQGGWGRPRQTPEQLAKQEKLALIRELTVTVQTELKKELSSTRTAIDAEFKTQRRLNEGQAEIDKGLAALEAQRERLREHLQLVDGKHAELRFAENGRRRTRAPTSSLSPAR